MTKQHYSIPFRDAGQHEDLYKNLVEINYVNEKINNIIDYAKKIAKEAGYSITGEKLDTYLFKNKKYPLQLKVYENDEYYIILFLPENVPITSQNLEISIHKKTKNIITILKGS